MDNVLGKYTDLNKTSPRIEDGYSEWLAGNNTIAPNNSEKLYIKNVIDLYQAAKQPNEDLRNDFNSFVNNMKFLFKNDVNYNRLDTIDYNDESQVRVILPILVSKIKEIISYYNHKRRSLKDDKTSLFINGTKNALELSLYNLFNDLSRKNPDNEKDLSSYNLTGLKVEYVQLYDLFNYYGSTDQDYVRNIEILSKNPIFFNIVNYLNDNLDAEKSDYDQSCNGDDLYDYENKIDLSQKYTSCFVQYLSGFNKFFQSMAYEKTLKKGENFFHWISGENFVQRSSDQIIPTSIHALDWTNATSSNEIQNSDIIFVNGPEGVKAAWLKSYDNLIVSDQMVAEVSDGIEFRFPFPFHGLSGDGLAWTGPSIRKSDIDLQLFYGKDYQSITESVNTLYWSTTSLGNSSSNDVLLNDTTLVESGAYASQFYNKADKIEIRTKANDEIFDGIYNDPISRAWLYNFKETEIPIIPGSNNIYWPLGRYDDTSELSLEYKWGDSVALSSINVTEQFVGAIASTTIEKADKIFRLKTYCGPDMECAWLKGIPLSAINPKVRDACNCLEDTKIYPTRRIYKSGTLQNYTYFKALPNTFTTFNLAGIGENQEIELNSIDSFRGYEHDATCQYPHEKLIDLYSDSKFNKRDIQVNQWKKCNCKSIKYSPFGHRGNVYTDFGGYTDFIVKHANIPKPFSFKTWRGSDGKDYLNSKDFAWFKLESSPDKNIGWGRGKWITSSGEEMILNEYDQYLYYRTSIDRCEGYEPPYAILKHSHCSCKYVDEDCKNLDCISVWMKAEKDENGNWIDLNEVSDMLMESNNFYRYEHQSESSYSTERLKVSGNFIDYPSDYTLSSENSSYSVFEEYSHSQPAMSFIWKCSITNARPYWTENNLNLSSTMVQL